MYREFLDSSIGLGRSLWTQYDTSLMWWGLAVLLAATASLAFRVVSTSNSPRTVAARRSGVSSASYSSGLCQQPLRFTSIMRRTRCTFIFGGRNVFCTVHITLRVMIFLACAEKNI